MFFVSVMVAEVCGAGRVSALPFGEWIRTNPHVCSLLVLQALRGELLTSQLGSVPNSFSGGSTCRLP